MDWVKGDALMVMRELAGSLPGTSYPTPPNNGVFREGDEVLLADGRVCVLIVDDLSVGEALRPVYNGQPQWRYWRDVVGWRRPDSTHNAAAGRPLQ